MNWSDLKLPPLNLWSFPEWRYNTMQNKYYVEHDDQNYHVMFDGFIVRSFNELSDDYAWTNAKEYCEKRNKELKNTKAMSQEEWDALPKHAKTSPLTEQIGGSHYKDMKIQPVEFITANNIGFLEGSVIKYVCRHKSKNGKQDLEKAKHFIDLIIELGYNDAQ